MIFAFAADKSQPTPAGTAPIAVQARQIPRLLVARLNADEDRRVRFFPFMGVVDGERRFFDIDEPFDPEQLRHIHGQSSLGFLIDGDLSVDKVTMRVHSANGETRVLLEVEAPFDPADPWPALRRLMFEITGQLAWRGGVPDLPDWTGPLLGWYLIAKDEQLALEAGMDCPDPSTKLRAAIEAFAIAPDEPEVTSVLLDTCRTLMARGGDGGEIAGLLLDALRRSETHDLEFVADAALVVEAGQGLDAATPLYSQIARVQPDHPSAPLKAGFGLYQQGRTEEGRKLLRSCYDAGNRDPALRAQLAAAEEECGDIDEREALLEGLVEEQTLPVPVARLVAAFLVDRDRSAEALALIDRVRAAGAEHAGLWLERGRAQVSLGRPDDAKQSFERCLAVEPEPDVRAEARRLLRLTDDVELLPNINELEDALRAGDLRRAASIARSLVRHRPRLAEAWLLLGVVRQRNSQFRRAMRAFSRAVQLQPDLGDAHNRLGVLLAARGKNRDGYEHLCKAVELIPHDASPWLHLAQVCLRLGKQAEGAEAFSRAERLGGHEAEIEKIRPLFAPDPES